MEQTAENITYVYIVQSISNITCNLIHKWLVSMQSKILPVLDPTCSSSNCLYSLMILKQVYNHYHTLKCFIHEILKWKIPISSTHLFHRNWKYNIWSSSRFLFTSQTFIASYLHLTSKIWSQTKLYTFLDKFLNFSLMCSYFYIGVFAFITRILHHLTFFVQRHLVEVGSTAQKGLKQIPKDYSQLIAPCIDGLGLKGLKGGLRCQHSVRFESRFKLRGKHHQNLESNLNAILVPKNSERSQVMGITFLPL